MESKLEDLNGIVTARKRYAMLVRKIDKAKINAKRPPLCKGRLSRLAHQHFSTN